MLTTSVLPFLSKEVVYEQGPQEVVYEQGLQDEAIMG